MNRLVRGWDRFWFGEMEPVPAALFRIAIGTLTFMMFVAAYTNWDRFYDADGMLSLNDPTVEHVLQGWWSLFWWTDGRVPTMAYWWVGALAALAFTVGWHTRAATVVLFLVVASAVHRNPMAVNGEELVVRMLLFYSCFASLGATWSLDARRRRRAGRPTPPAPNWPIRLMQVNLALIYMVSQPYKLASDPTWLTGDAMYYVMINRTWSRFPWPQVYYHWWVAALSTWGSLVMELAFPLTVWFRRLRPWMVLAMGTLHVTIAIVLESVTFFSLAMTCSFFAYLTLDDLHRIREAPRRLLAVMGRGRRRAEGGDALSRV